VPGVIGIKRAHADLPIQLTSQPLKHFGDNLSAKECLDRE